MEHPKLLSAAGLTPEVLHAIDHLVVGCGGFVKELISFTAGASELKDDAGQRVSAADRLVDRLLREHLAFLVPDSGGYSEEFGPFGARENARVRWLIDPVDGTRPATLGGAFAVSVGALVVEDNVPAAAVGWVYVPTLRALYRGIVAPRFAECLLNGQPTAAESGLRAKDLRNRYVAVSSDWHSLGVSGCPLKLSAPGATAVHLAQLVHAASDVAAAALTRYRAYDAAAGLALALAGGCRLYALDADTGAPTGEPLELLSFLAEADYNPEALGPRVFVCTSEVAGLLGVRS